MRHLLAVDPSLTCTGLAMYHGDKLIATGHVKPGTREGGLAERAARIARKVGAWARIHSEEYDVVVEWPWIYPSHKNKTNPNKALMPLAAICGAVAASPYVLEITSYKPDEWTQGIPKSTKKSETNIRANRIKSRLTPKELEIFVKAQTHDEIDAIGLGLYRLGRFERRRAWHLK